MLQPNHTVAGRYRVVRHIASGGMGAVYEAEHLGTEARVALKLLLPQLLQVPAARRRFELEARVAARVNSEHIVRVLDAGVDTETHSPYLAMELLAGETLAMRIKQTGPLAPSTAIEVLRQVARGLDAAHGYRAGDGTTQPIVHRDLKPENLFLTRRADGTTLVKILDFGIAKVLSHSTGVSQEVRGTPLYMAYEQLTGDVVSAQTDVWALGLITHFVLTGRSYWLGANHATVSAEALFAQILTLPLPPPSQRLAGEGLGLHVPPAFDAWLLRCIERDPSRRFASAGSALTALEGALANTQAFASSGGSAAWRLGGRFGSRVTAQYELPSSVSSSSVTSLPPVASEPRRKMPAGSRRAWLELSGAVTVAALAAVGVAWGVMSLRARGAARDVTGATAPSSADTNVPRDPGIEVRRVDEVAPPRAPEGDPPGAPQVEPVAPRQEAPAAATPPPRVRVEALQPAPPPVKKASPAPTPAAPPPAPPADGASSSKQPASKPVQGTTGDAPCDAFDPYTGRCAIAAPARDRAERR